MADHNPDTEIITNKLVSNKSEKSLITFDSVEDMVTIFYVFLKEGRSPLRLFRFYKFSTICIKLTSANIQGNRIRIVRLPAGPCSKEAMDCIYHNSHPLLIKFDSNPFHDSEPELTIRTGKESTVYRIYHEYEKKYEEFFKLMKLVRLILQNKIYNDKLLYYISDNVVRKMDINALAELEKV